MGIVNPCSSFLYMVLLTGLSYVSYFEFLDNSFVFRIKIICLIKKTQLIIAAIDPNIGCNEMAHISISNIITTLLNL